MDYARLSAALFMLFTGSLSGCGEAPSENEHEAALSQRHQKLAPACSPYKALTNGCKMVIDGGNESCFNSRERAEYPYAINLQSFTSLNKTDLPANNADKRKAVEFLVQSAAQTWNHQTTVANFRYVGDTTLTALPEQSCGPDPVSLISLNDDCSGGHLGRGHAHARCYDDKGVAQAFHIVVNKCPYGGNEMHWIGSQDNIPEGQHYSLHHLFMHELGHTLNVGHLSEINDLMTDSTYIPSFYSRTVGPTDLPCAQQLIQPRDAKAYAYEVSGGGLAQATAPNNTMARVAASGDDDLYRTMSRASCPGLGVWDDGASSCLTPRETDGMSLAVGDAWASQARTYFSSPFTFESHTGFNEEGVTISYKSRAVQVWDDAFMATEDLEWCEGSCSTHEKVTSAHRIATAWDDWSNNPIWAWVELAPGVEDEYLELKVSVGQHPSAGKLNPPQELDTTQTLRSLIGPGLACEPFSVGNNFDCLVAFVDEADFNGQIKFKHFYVQSGGSVFVDTAVYSGPTTMKTASEIALWRQEGLFWLVIKSTLASEPILVFTSSDGVAWSLDWNASFTIAKDIDTSIEGPRVLQVSPTRSVLTFTHPN